MTNIGVYGEVIVAARISGKMTPGNVALPHGWGHHGNWQEANSRGGVNSNRLASCAPEDADPFSGGSVLNGIPVRIEAVKAESSAVPHPVREVALNT